MRENSPAKILHREEENTASAKSKIRDNLVYFLPGAGFTGGVFGLEAPSPPTKTRVRN